MPVKKGLETYWMHHVSFLNPLALFGFIHFPLIFFTSDLLNLPSLSLSLYIYIYIYISESFNHHHHHIVLAARISLTLYRHSSLSFIALGRSSGQQPVSSHSCWMYVRAGRPAFARPCVGIHKSTSLMSSSLLGCTTWTLTKRLEKKLDGNYTRMLRAILNKSWQQHPTRHQLYGHLPPITKTIQVRRTRHAGHCWRSRVI